MNTSLRLSMLWLSLFMLLHSSPAMTFSTKHSTPLAPFHLYRFSSSPITNASTADSDETDDEGSSDPQEDLQEMARKLVQSILAGKQEGSQLSAGEDQTLGDTKASANNGLQMNFANILSGDHDNNAAVTSSSDEDTANNVMFGPQNLISSEAAVPTNQNTHPFGFKVHSFFKVTIKRKNNTSPNAETIESVPANSQCPSCGFSSIWNNAIPLLVKNNQATVHSPIDFNDMSQIVPEIQPLVTKLAQIHKMGHVAVIIMNPKNIRANKVMIKRTNICCQFRSILLNNGNMDSNMLGDNENFGTQENSNLLNNHQFFNLPVSGNDEDDDNASASDEEEENGDNTQDSSTEGASMGGHSIEDVLSRIMSNLHAFHEPGHVSAISFNPHELKTNPNPQLRHIKIRMLPMSGKVQAFDNQNTEDNSEKMTQKTSQGLFDPLNASPIEQSPFSNEKPKITITRILNPQTYQNQLDSTNNPAVTDNSLASSPYDNLKPKITITKIPLREFMKNSPPPQPKKPMIYFIIHKRHQDNPTMSASPSDEIRSDTQDSLSNGPSSQSIFSNYPSFKDANSNNQNQAGNAETEPSFPMDQILNHFSKYLSDGSSQNQLDNQQPSNHIDRLSSILSAMKNQNDQKYNDQADKPNGDDSESLGDQDSLNSIISQMFAQKNSDEDKPQTSFVQPNENSDQSSKPAFRSLINNEAESQLPDNQDTLNSIFRQLFSQKNFDENKSEPSYVQPNQYSEDSNQSLKPTFRSFNNNEADDQSPDNKDTLNSILRQLFAQKNSDDDNSQTSYVQPNQYNLDSDQSPKPAFRSLMKNQAADDSPNNQDTLNSIFRQLFAQKNSDEDKSKTSYVQPNQYNEDPDQSPRPSVMSFSNKQDDDQSSKDQNSLNPFAKLLMAQRNPNNFNTKISSFSPNQYSFDSTQSPKPDDTQPLDNSKDLSPFLQQLMAQMSNSNGDGSAPLHFKIVKLGPGGIQSPSSTMSPDENSRSSFNK